MAEQITFVFCVLPFGLSSAPTSSQKSPEFSEGAGDRRVYAVNYTWMMDREGMRQLSGAAKVAARMKSDLIRAGVCSSSRKEH